MVVEDDYLMAQLLVDLLEDAGASIVGPFGWVHEALSVAANRDIAFDSAVLDISLHGHKSYPIADVLTERGIKVVFSTGYGSGAIDERYLHYPQCTKPYRVQAILAALNQK